MILSSMYNLILSTTHRTLMIFMTAFFSNPLEGLRSVLFADTLRLSRHRERRISVCGRLNRAESRRHRAFFGAVILEVRSSKSQRGLRKEVLSGARSRGVLWRGRKVEKILATG